MKFKTVRSRAVRDSANGENCTVNIARVCNYNPATTVLAHINTEGGKMGGKESDLSACYACSECHDRIDGRVMNAEFKEYEWFYLARAITRTIKLLYQKEIIKVKGVKCH